MYYSNCYRCDSCGDERDLSCDSDDGGRCMNCETGHYKKCGESYDKEWLDEQKYNREQDEEYERRHRNDY